MEISKVSEEKTVHVISKMYEHFRGEKGNCENRNPFRSITCSKEYLRNGKKVQITRY